MSFFWIALGVLISTVALGAILGNTKAVSHKIVMAYHCPAAISVTEKLGPTVVEPDLQPIGQTLLGGTCTFADGSTQVISAREYFVTTMVGALGLGAVISVTGLFVFMSIYLRWKKSTKITEEVR